MPDEIENDNDLWREWYDLDAPEETNYPFNYHLKLKDFEKLMFLRCFRIDRVYRALSWYIKRVMGEEYITTPVVT